ncbi:HAD family hydrolase [Candidatus Woesearchaeota archaeon]|nr:HAD family hydrolase [Candidatus Woesearchaeota archaeon]
MNKAIFLDRDGVLNSDTNGYPHKPEHLSLAKNAREGMKLLSNLGFKMFIVTNQSGVGLGIYSREDFRNFTNALLKEIGDVDDVFACFHAKEDECECRKPSPKMLHDAARKHNVELGKSYVIGDQDRDIQMGKYAGCITVFVSSGAFGTEKSTGRSADYIASDLRDAAEWIAENETKKPE